MKNTIMFSNDMDSNDMDGTVIGVWHDAFIYVHTLYYTLVHFLKL